MHLYNMQSIRQSKRISRKNLADYLKTDPNIIKSLETLDLEEFINNTNSDKASINDLINAIADYLNVRPLDLILPDIDLENNNLRKVLKVFKVKFDETIDDDKIKDLFIKVLVNNKSEITSENLETFVSELNYRFGDVDNELKSIHTVTKPKQINELIRELEFNMDEKENNTSSFDPYFVYDKAKLLKNEISFYTDKELGFGKAEVDGIRQNARTVATIYKELVANKLPHTICIDILRVMIDVDL